MAIPLNVVECRIKELYEGNDVVGVKKRRYVPDEYQFFALKRQGFFIAIIDGGTRFNYF